MQPCPDVHVVGDVENQLPGPFGPAVASQHNKCQEFHDRNYIGFLPFSSQIPESLSILIYFVRMENLGFPVDGPYPIQGCIPPVIRARAVTPGSANRSRIGRQFLKH